VPASKTRATHAMNIRGMDADAARRIKAAAGARGLTLGDYLARLVTLHEQMRILADAGHEHLQPLLEKLGLQTVRR
jgi:hypothetical protein